MKMEYWQAAVSAWAESTFTHDARGIALHTVREVVEMAIAAGVSADDIRGSVEKELGDAANKGTHLGEEMADVQILLFTLAGYKGIDLESCLDDKHYKNQRRTWGKPDAQGITEHVREAR